MKRKELCSNAPSCVESLSEERVTFRLVPELSNRIFSSGFDADERVNLLHMELFYHFEKVTVPTLSFDIWPHMLQLSFQVRRFHTLGTSFTVKRTSDRSM